MAQAEDTELRDLVIEALERNGSLAKIRALLRANIFLAFEEECETMKQNVNLDKILKLPEGVIALSLIHEFLEFSCLKNTLFVYMSESRQGNEYNYEGKKSLRDKLNISQSDAFKEPILLTLVKCMLKTLHKKSFDTSNSHLKNYSKCDDKNYEDDQNCTYILHEDSQSSSTSNSNSDNSSDEKNKLHLRLQLDNSDTDTSSDFARDKSSSEYIPGDHILESNNNTGINISSAISLKSVDCVDTKVHNLFTQNKLDKNTPVLNSEFKINSSSDSTSYMDLKPFNSIDEKMINTSGLPVVTINTNSPASSQVKIGQNTQNDPPSPKCDILDGSSPKSSKEKVENNDNKSPTSIKSDGTCNFSYGDDFSASSSSLLSKLKDHADKQIISADSQKGNIDKSSNKISPVESPRHAELTESPSKQSSLSLSDVADLISEKSSKGKENNSINSLTNSKHKINDKLSNIQSDDSGDFTQSPVPSLSNLSLDIHSD